MDYNEIKINVNVSDIERVENVVSLIAPDGFYIEDYSNLEQDVLEIAHIDIIDEKLLNKDRSLAMIHIYLDKLHNPNEVIDFINTSLSNLGIKFEIFQSECLQSDWADNWRQYYKPINIGSKLLICPKWLSEDIENPEKRKILKMEPGMAFGTGTHETTRLCLEMADKYISPNMTILDVGCGSGILSVGALLLGAKTAFAVDIDELATKVAYENAVDNGVQSQFNVVVGNLADKVIETYDFCFANIVADAIISLNTTIEKHIKPNGYYVMSGIIDSRLDEILSSLPNCFNVIDSKIENGWAALCVQKK